MEITEVEIRGIIGLVIGFAIMLCISGWFMYSFYYKPEILDKRKTQNIGK